MKHFPTFRDFSFLNTKIFRKSLRNILVFKLPLWYVCTASVEWKFQTGIRNGLTATNRTAILLDRAMVQTAVWHHPTKHVWMCKARPLRATKDDIKWSFAYGKHLVTILHWQWMQPLTYSILLNSYRITTPCFFEMYLNPSDDRKKLYVRASV